MDNQRGEIAVRLIRLLSTAGWPPSARAYPCRWRKRRTQSENGKLGVSPRALNYKVKKFAITHPSWKKNRDPEGETATDGSDPAHAFARKLTNP